MANHLPLTLALAVCIPAGPLTRAQVKPKRTFVGQKSPYCVALSANGKVLASGGLYGSLKVWNMGTGKERASLSDDVPVRDKGEGIRVAAESVAALALNPDGSLLASGHDGGAVKLWDVTTGKLAANLDRYKGQVWAVAFSPDGKLLAAGGGETTARIWDVATRKLRVELSGGDEPFAAFAFAKDGSVVATGNGMNDTITLWDLKTGKVKTQWKVGGDNVSAVALSPDGRLLAAGGGFGFGMVDKKDRTLTLWDAATRKERAALRGHDRAVKFVAFSGDGKLLASADDLNTARVWDVATGKELTIIKTGENIAPKYGLISGAAFSKDGKFLVIAARSPDNVLVWDVSSSK